MSNLDCTESGTSRHVHIPLAGRRFRLHYHDTGSGEAVVLLHGAGAGAGGWSNFSRNLPALADAGFRALAPDCPGFNGSDALLVEQSRALLNAQAVVGLMDELGLERVHIVGNSLGGASALEFALAFPQRLGRLVLMGPGGLGPSLFQPLPMEGIKLLMGLYREPTRENLQRMLQVFVHDPSRLTPELVEGRFASMMARPEHLKNFVESFARNPATLLQDLTPRLGEIPHPSLVVWGRDDRFVPLDHGLKLVWGLRDARLHVFGQCGHWAQWEHADAFNRLIIDFLRH